MLDHRGFVTEEEIVTRIYRKMSRMRRRSGDGSSRSVDGKGIV
jgi:hypothetical protein